VAVVRFMMICVSQPAWIVVVAVFASGLDKHCLITVLHIEEMVASGCHCGCEMLDEKPYHSLL